MNEEIDRLYTNMHTVFDISFGEFTSIIKHITTVIKIDEFYSDIVKLDKMLMYLEKGGLLKIKKYLTSIELEDDVIKNIIVNTPEILLFSDRLEYIFPIFKGDDFKGYALLNENDYRAYSILSMKDRYYDVNYECYKNDLVVKSMLGSLSRKDVMDYYNITEKSSLLDKFYALSAKYNKRNYYFYKEENPLIALKAKLTTRDDDNLYYCDICGNGFNDHEDLKTYHIIPLEEGGVDDIYNIACMCNECSSSIKNMTYDEYSEDLIRGLYRRAEKKFPEYLVKMNSYFNSKGIVYQIGGKRK